MRRCALTWRRALMIAVLVGWPGAAWARPQFPEVIATTLEGTPPAHVPPCSVCHLGGKTSGATVFTPFAWAMRVRGLTGDESSVASAIKKVQADGVDSDGDGVPDAQEIIDGTDPNNAGGATDLQDPQLGCDLGGGARSGTAAAFLALAAFALVRRRGKNRER
jgi:hypothetical protein